MEKFIVLDVEGSIKCRTYNVGYIIADRNGKIYKKHSFAFPECFWENLTAKDFKDVSKMTHKNIQEILTDNTQSLRKRKYKMLNVNTFFKMFTKEIQKYKIKKMYAYNVSFDKNALNRLFGERFNDLQLEYRDIINGILFSKLLTKRYVDFCLKNEYITDKGNFRYSAEIVYRFLTGDKTFNEEHTGLADVLIEYYILLTAFKTHKRINWAGCCVWKKLKEFAESHEYI